MKCYAVPYEGDQDYLFFSYCHDNAGQVYPIIERLVLEGFRVWYDDGIHPGEDWPQVIAEHLSRATACVAAISRASAESHNCRNEVSFAVANNKPFLSIILEDFKMPLGMKLQLSSSRFLEHFGQSEDVFYDALLNTPTLAACRMSGVYADPSALKAWRNHAAEYIERENAAPAAPASESAAQIWFQNEQQKENIDQPAESGAPAGEGPTPVQEVIVQMESRHDEELLNPSPKANEGQEGEEAVYLKKARPRARAELRIRAAAPEKAQAADTPAEHGAEQVSERCEDENDKTVIINRDHDTVEDEPTVANLSYNPALLIRAKTSEVYFIHNEKTVVGRTKGKADIVISGNNTISGKHIAILKRKSGYSLLNLKPTNETIVDDRELEAEEEVILNSSSEIVLAGEQFLLLYGDVYDQVFDEQMLCLLSCKETGEVRIVAEDRIFLDRNHQWRNKVLGDTRISRAAHAEVYSERGTRYLRDLNSKNGTYLNGRRLSPGESTTLKDGDTIAVVDTEFMYQERRIGV